MDVVIRGLLEALEALRDDVVPLTPTLSASRARAAVAARFDPDTPRPLADVLLDARELLREGTCHASHPRHFGLFNPTTTAASVAADALAAHYNPQLSVAAASPFAAEAERYVLSALASRMGLGAAWAMHFTSGGAEANHTALACALSRAVPGYAVDGLAAGGVRPTVYVSAEAHGSVRKAAQACGLGRAAVREVAVDGALRMKVSELRRRIAHDRAAGFTPAMVVATAGTTGAGAIDPLEALVDVAREAGAWLHVDAAWGGVACLAPETRGLLAGVERADSVTWDAHKSLPVAMGAGMFFCAQAAVLREVFAVEAPYMVRGVDADDPYLTTMQWSRRFIGLKVLVTLASRGWRGVAEDVARQFALGDRLRAGLRAAGWQVLNDTPLPVVCFTHPRVRSGALPARRLMHALWREKVAWVSELRVGGRVPALRACVTNVDTREADVDALVAGATRLVSGG